MNMMNDVLSNYLGDFVLVFLNDILVYSFIVEIYPEHLGKVLEALCRHRLFCKGVKVQHHSQRGRAPWTVDYATRGCSFEAKDEGCRGVGSSPRPEGGQIICGVCQLLSLLCTRICGVGILIDLPYKERCSMGMGAPSTTSFPEIKTSFM